MKKIIPVLLLIILCVALCACTETGGTAEGGKGGLNSSSTVAVNQVELSVDSANKNFYIYYFDFKITNVSGDGETVKLVDEYSNGYDVLKPEDTYSSSLEAPVSVAEGKVNINIRLGLYVDAFTVEAPCYHTFEGTYYAKAEDGQIRFYEDSEYIEEVCFDFSFVDYPITSTKNFSDSYEVGIVVRY